MAYVTPRHYYSTRDRRLRLIVMHTMESPEAGDTAESVAAWFAGPTSPVASAHACIDNDSIVLCLPPSATAFAAPGCNADGYQIELAGRAGQGAAGWADAYSQAELRLAAAHARSIAQSAGIPLVHLTDAQLAAGAAGFVGHDQVSRVYNRSDHTDPGPTFPWDQYMSLVRQDDTPTPTTTLTEDTMRLVRSKQSGTCYTVTPTDVTGFGSTALLSNLQAVYGSLVDLDNADIGRLSADAAARRAREAAAVAAASGTIDADQLAASITPALTGPLVAALTAQGATGLTEAQVRTATEDAVRSVFADAGEAN